MSSAEPRRLINLFGNRATRPSVTVYQYYHSHWVGNPSSRVDWINTILRDRPGRANEYLIVIGLRQDHLEIGSLEQRKLATMLDGLLTDRKTGSARTRSDQDVLAILGASQPISEWVQSKMPRGHLFADDLKDIAVDLVRTDRWYFFGDQAHLATPEANVLSHLDDTIVARLSAQMPRGVKTLAVQVRVNGDRITDRINSLKQEVTQVLDRLEFATTYAGVQFTVENRARTVSISAMGVALAVEVCQHSVVMSPSRVDNSDDDFAHSMVLELSRLRGDVANEWLNCLRQELLNVISDHRTAALRTFDSFVALSAGLTGNELIQTARQIERMCEFNHCVLSHITITQ